MNDNDLKLVDFYEEFKEEVKGDIKEKYHAGDFSKYIFPKIEAVLKGKEYSCLYEEDASKDEKKYQKEYYRIDLVGWTQRKKELEDKLEQELKNKTGKCFNGHLWNLDVAIEHENNNEDWLDEVIKLCYINCPLRIVIGYVERKLNNYLDDEKFLEIVVKAINLIDEDGKRKLIKENDEFGIILGSKKLDEENFLDNYQLYKIKRINNKYTYGKYCKDIGFEYK